MRWRFWPVVLVAILSFAGASIAAFISARAFSIPIAHLDQLTPGQIAILTVAQDLTLALVLVGLLRVWPKVGLRELGVGRPIAARTGFIAGAGLWLLSIVVANAQAALVGSHPQSLVLAAQSHRSVEGLIVDVVFGGALVGVVEELFFRAMLFTLLRQRLPFAAAAVSSSVIFALVHEMAAWIPVFALGMGLAYLYERRHSLWTNALAHGTVNALSFVTLFVLPLTTPS